MSFQADRPIVKDDNNSTTATLAASATYTGTATDILAYHQVHLVAYMEPNVTPNGDANTAQASLYVEFGPDGTNWDISIPIYVRSGIFIPQTYVTVDRYFRVRWINDGGTAAIASLGLSETADTPRNQTAFRLNTYLVPQGTKELGRTIDQSVGGSDPVSLTRGVVMGKDPDGTYVNARMSRDNEVFVTGSPAVDDVRAVMSLAGITSTTYEVLVDLSDTTNFPHEETGRIDLTQLKVAVDPGTTSAGFVKVGLITRIDGTDADIEYFFVVPFGKQGGRILSISNFNPSQIKCEVSGGAATKFISDDTETSVAAVNTGASLNSPNGSINPGLGDVVVKYQHTSGNAWDGLVSCFYHSHA